MNLQDQIPVFIIKKSDSTILYFDVDTDKIKKNDMIDKAYLTINTEKNEIPNKDISCYLNDHLTADEWNFIHTNNRNILCFQDEVNLFIDITDKIHFFFSNMVENNGLVIKADGYDVKSCRLLLIYRNDIIFPNCCCHFFEKELVLSSRTSIAYSPWFLTEKSTIITFFAKNLGNHAITIQIENSPNTVDVVLDGQIMNVLPDNTELIFPQRFSKYTRIAAVSDHKPIVLKLYFQSQITLS